MTEIDQHFLLKSLDMTALAEIACDELGLNLRANMTRTEVIELIEKEEARKMAKHKTAFVIVDTQVDFVEGGSLGVTGGKAIARAIALHTLINADKYNLVVTTQDWHINPGKHFDTWPVHCEANTEGASLVQDIASAVSTLDSNVWQPIHKGQYSDGYSGFDGITTVGDIPLVDVLRNRGITHVIIVGIATDHCVKATALDAIKEGFVTTVLTDQIAGVTPETSVAALEEMATAGVVFKKSTELTNEEN